MKQFLVWGGSSPHTRGARRHRRQIPRPRRIIPAYAGSTRRASSRRTTTGDHPRIRGEHADIIIFRSIAAGSSPHTRGALGAECHGLPGVGIIPAYAGSTGRQPRPLARGPDHPRIRGEHTSFARWFHGRMGSSPHTRGAPLLRRAVLKVIWIIPAYAGSTRSSTVSGSPSQDHPRIRGEHIHY